MIYLWLFLEFLKIGLFTFGGGYAMIPLIKETVVTHGWMVEEEILDFIGLCEATPGPIAVNMASFIGFNQGGILGAIVATFGVVLPSFIIIILVASILGHFLNKKPVKHFFIGVKPVIIGLICATGFITLIKVLGYQNLYTFNFNLVSLKVIVFLITILFTYKFLFKKNLNSVFLIVISAGLGILFSVLENI